MRPFTVYSSYIFCKNLYEIFKIIGYAIVTSKKGVDYMDMILKTTVLCKNFKGQMAVNNVSLNIQRNSIYGLLGPNGSRYKLKISTT